MCCSLKFTILCSLKFTILCYLRPSVALNVLLDIVFSIFDLLFVQINKYHAKRLINQIIQPKIPNNSSFVKTFQFSMPDESILFYFYICPTFRLSCPNRTHITIGLILHLIYWHKNKDLLLTLPF